MTTDISASEKTFFGHPKALFILFFTEMWERFSFYGMKALLIFYLTKYHLFSDVNGNLQIGSYAALVYAVPVIGWVGGLMHQGMRCLTRLCACAPPCHAKS